MLSPPALFYYECAVFALVVSMISAMFFGLGLAATVPTTIACAAILVFGLPHGALDLELLQMSKGQRSLSRPLLVLVYLTFAGATYALWVVHPLIGLGAFLIVAVVHFADDWQACRAPLLAIGLALATLTAPLIFHHADIEVLFVSLSGDRSATALADVLMLLAPVAVLVGAVACFDLWQNDRKSVAVAGAITLVAMLTLPPVIGFALYFCLLHSPVHLRDNVQVLFRRTGGGYQTWIVGMIVALVTLAALGLTALIYAAQPHTTSSAPFFRSTFIVLSILTVPHMLMPHFVAAIRHPVNPAIDRWGERTRCTA